MSGTKVLGGFVSAVLLGYVVVVALSGVFLEHVEQRCTTTVAANVSSAGVEAPPPESVQAMCQCVGQRMEARFGSLRLAAGVVGLLGEKDFSYDEGESIGRACGRKVLAASHAASAAK